MICDSNHMSQSYCEQIDNTGIQILFRWRRLVSAGDESSFLPQVELDVKHQEVGYSLEIGQSFSWIGLSKRLVIVDLLQFHIDSIMLRGITVIVVDIHRMSSILRDQLTEFVLWAVGVGGVCMPYVVVVV
jgi:hypothetical protein